MIIYDDPDHYYSQVGNRNANKTNSKRIAVNTYNESRIALLNFQPNFYDILLIDIILLDIIGELLAELKGKSVDQRVLYVAVYTIEVSASLSGNIRGIPVNILATYVSRVISPSGKFYGKGQGIVMGGESGVATFTGEGFRKVDPSGNTRWLAAFFYQTKSTSNLAFLNDIVGLSENEVDPEGDIIDKQRE